MEEQLLAAIVANPNDNGARLVYGDWLLAQGDPRGELIVVQCRLAEGALNAAEEKKLRAAEKKLEKALERAWLEPIRARLGYPPSHLEALTLRAYIDRGFVSAVQAPADILLRLDDLFAVAPLLTELRIGSIPPYDGLTRLEPHHFESPLLSRLRGLVVGIPGSGDSLLRLIAACPHLSNLTKLAFTGARFSGLLFGADMAEALTVAGAHALVASRSLTGLKELYLDGDQLGDGGIEAIAHASWKLDVLSVSDNDATGDSFVHIAKAPSLAGLRRLNLRESQPTTPDQAATLASSRHLSSLVALDIERCGLGPKGLAAFLEALKLPALEELIAASNGFAEEGAALIAQSKKLSKLRVLDITKNAFHKKGVITLARGDGLAGIGKVLLNERDTPAAREALASSAALAKTSVYFRGKLIAKPKPVKTVRPKRA